MDCSFTPKGAWFVFCASTGKTLKKNLSDKAHAVRWMAAELESMRRAAAEVCR